MAFVRSADCQSAIQQIANLRYGRGAGIWGYEKTGGSMFGRGREWDGLFRDDSAFEGADFAQSCGGDLLAASDSVVAGFDPAPKYF